MKIVADTNLLVRVLTQDDPTHFAAAARVLSEANTVILTTVALCETVWTLRSRYHWRTADIAAAIRVLINDPRADVDLELADLGLAFLDAGGDFADAVIAATGRRDQAATFVTFDKKAARLLEASGVPVLLLP